MASASTARLPERDDGLEIADWIFSWTRTSPRALPAGGRAPHLRRWLPWKAADMTAAKVLAHRAVELLGKTASKRSDGDAGINADIGTSATSTCG